MIKVLYVEGCRDGTVGGSHICLYSLVSNLDRNKYYPIVVFYNDQIIAEQLRSLGIEIKIFENCTPLDISMKLKKIISIKKAGIFLPIQKAINFIWFFLKPTFIYARFIKKNNIDIVHLNNSLNTNHEWMLASKLAGVKLISHQRGYSNNINRTIKYFSTQIDVLICISNDIKNSLIKQGLAKNKSIVIYDGIDISKPVFKSNPAYLKQKYHIEQNDSVVGIVGNIKKWKGQETVVRAISNLKIKFPTIKCLLVGGVNDLAYKNYLDQIIQDLEISNNIIFTDFQKNPTDFINIMDIFIHASIEPEPFGMVNLEAMHLKKPVISTNIGGPTEIFQDNENGFLIEPGNSMLLAKKICLLLENFEIRKKIGLNAYNTVVNKFSLFDTVRQIENIYDNL